MEYLKHDNKYLKNNVRRDFGLTLWQHTDELYPWVHMPLKKINNDTPLLKAPKKVFIWKSHKLWWTLISMKGMHGTSKLFIYFFN